MSTSGCRSSVPTPAPARQRCRRCRSRVSWLHPPAAQAGPAVLTRPWHCQGFPLMTPLLLLPLGLGAVLSLGGSCVGFGLVCAWEGGARQPLAALCPRGRVPVLAAWPDVLREHRESAGPRGWVSSCTLCQGHCIGSGCEPAAKWSKRSADKGLFFISY